MPITEDRAVAYLNVHQLTSGLVHLLLLCIQTKSGGCGQSLPSAVAASWPQSTRQRLLNACTCLSGLLWCRVGRSSATTLLPLPAFTARPCAAVGMWL
jgi:hypothetical protein